MKKLLTILLLLTYGICSGQNLVPNGDFEQYWHCPNNVSQIDSAKYWIRPTLGTSDYFNQCGSGYANIPNTIFGFQQARSGVAYAGIYNYNSFVQDYREYIESPLLSPLVANTLYHFEMYFNVGNICAPISYNVGIYFSDTIIQSINNNVILPFTPQINNISTNYPDTLNWKLISGTYNAQGGENYIIIGNFDNISSTVAMWNTYGIDGDSYIYLDDISLTQSIGVGLNNYDNEIEINLFPNPITDKLTINIDNNIPTEIILFDLSSRKLLQQTFTYTTTINTEQLAKGIYLYTVRNKNGIIKNGKVIKQ